MNKSFRVDIDLADMPDRNAPEYVAMTLESLAVEVRRRARNMPSWIFQEYGPFSITPNIDAKGIIFGVDNSEAPDGT